MKIPYQSRIIGIIVLCAVGIAVGGCSASKLLGIDIKAPRIKTPIIVRPFPPSPSPSSPLIPAPSPSDGLNYRSSEFNNNYGLSRIRAASAYQRGYFGQGVVVGVIDTGVRTSHVELSGNTVAGRDFVFPGTTITDPDGHGTAVAAVIAGKRNRRGMHGVAPQAKIMPLKIGDSSGSLVGDWRDAMRHAVANNVPIINNSFSDTGESLIGTYRGQTYYAEVPFLRGFLSDRTRRLAQEAVGIVRNKDTVVVWAAGNGGWNGVNGRIRLRRSCTDLRTPGCVSDSVALSLTRNQFVTGFISQSFYDSNGNVIAGAGRLSDTDGSDVPDLSSYYSSIPLWSVIGINTLLEGLADGAISEDEAGRRLLADTNLVSSLGRWVAVVATDSNDRIASYSNACGLAFVWCLAAPGSSIYTADSDSDTDYQTISGTSFAAPHVSGALAVLKSRLPSVSMSVIVGIMLQTATDLGTPGVDETYGWGLLNLDAAIKLQGRLQLKTTASSSSKAQLLNARIDLPEQFAHIKKELSGTQVAVGGIGDSYFNIALADITHITAPRNAALGDAASDMLAVADHERFNAGRIFTAIDGKSGKFRYVGANIDGGIVGNWRLHHNFCDDCKTSAWHEWNTLNAATQAATPFFAKDKGAFVMQMRGEGLRPFAAIGGDKTPYQQFGLRWSKSGDNFGLLAELSETNESDSFWQADFGALGAAQTKTQQAKFVINGNFAEHWRGFASYQRAHADATIAPDGLLNSVKNLRADGWAAGLQRRHVFAGGDRLRFLVRQPIGLRRGQVVLRHAVAEGDFNQSFYNGRRQTIRQQNTVINLAAPSQVSFVIGYAMQPRPKTQLAFGLEHQTSNHETAFSARMNMDF